MKRFMILSVVLFCAVFPAFTQVIEREILVDNMLIKYSFSNSLNGIENAIKRITRIDPHLENAAWILETEMPEVIKNIMDSLDVNFAMTPHIILADRPYGSGSLMRRNAPPRTYEQANTFGTARTGTLHRRVGNQWFTHYFQVR